MSSLRKLWVGVVWGLHRKDYPEGVRLCLGETRQDIVDDMLTGMYDGMYDEDVASERELLRLLKGEGLLQRYSIQEWDWGDETFFRYKQWVEDLQSGMYVNCVYCGHRYGPKETTPVTMADALTAHIAACPEHPMSKLMAAVEKFLPHLPTIEDAKNEAALNEGRSSAYAAAGVALAETYARLRPK
jgi:SHS2 domain-containing protein